ncbi:dedicator of cytokinesis-domain-containing protein, partial [Thamnocephalis sphaerospora]
PLPAVPAVPRGPSTMGRREPLVDAVAEVLREWCSLLHTYLREQRYELFTVMRDLMFELFNGRRQLISQALPQDALVRLRQQLVQLIAYGNRLQNLDQVARSAEGEVLGQAGQAMALYREHLRLSCSDLRPGAPITTVSAEAFAPSPAASSLPRSTSVRMTRRNTAWDVPVEPTAFFHLSLDLDAFVASVCSSNERVELYFWLYDCQRDRQLSECFICELTENGVAADHDKIGRLRTVFLELTERELLEDDLYVVCRVVRRGRMVLGVDEAFRDASVDYASPGPLADGRFSTGDRGASDGHGTQAAGTLSESRLSNDIRRPVGVAVLSLREALRSHDTDRAEVLLGEHVLPIYKPATELNFAELHRAIISQQTSEFTRAPKAEAVCISLRLFRGDTDAIIRAHSNWLLDAARSLRLGFPDVVAPGLSRNHLYVRLVSGEFTHGLKRQVRSVECRVEVRNNADGHRLSDMIVRASGDHPMSYFSSMVLHHCNLPVWEEAFRLDIPVGQFEDAHLFFTFRHVNTYSTEGADEKNFAFGVLPLVGGDGCAIRDGERQLTLFKWDPRVVRPVVYLRCLVAPIVAGATEEAHSPVATTSSDVSIHAGLDASGGPRPQVLKDTFVLRSLLCSTRYSQASALINLLHWKRLVRNRRSDLISILYQFAFVDEMEIVKFLQDVFDALCEILGCTWYRDLHAADSARQVTTQAVTAVIRVLSIVNDRRFNNFQPVVAMYLARHMRAEDAWRDLLSTLRRFVDDPCNPDHAVTFRAALKVWNELIGFAVRSRALQRQGEYERDELAVDRKKREDDFHNELRGLFAELTRLMRVSEPQSVIGAQTIAARCVHRAFSVELIGCLGAEEVTQLAIQFIDAVGRRSFITGALRLRAVNDLVDGPLMDDSKTRPVITHAVVRWLSESLEAPDEGKPDKWRDSVQPAFAILIRLAERLREASSSRRAHRALCASNALSEYAAAEEASLSEAVTAVLTMLPKLAVACERLVNAEVPRAVKAASVHVFNESLDEVVGGASVDLAAVPPSALSGVGELAVAALMVFTLPTDEQLEGYLRSTLHIEGEEITVTFLMRLFEMLEAMLTETAFPRDWFNASLTVCRDGLRILRPIARLLIEAFIPEPMYSDQFRQPLWGAFFRVVLRLLSRPHLQQEQLTAQQRLVADELAGDLREEGAQLLRDTWSAIGWEQNGHRAGGYQVRFTQRLLSSFLDLGLSANATLRECACYVLFSVCFSEYVIYRNLKRVEVECMDKLDKLGVWQRASAEEVRLFFVRDLRRQFSAPGVPADLTKQSEGFLNNIHRFLELLFHVRSLPSGDEFEDERIVGTLKLLRFVKNIDQDEIYVKYVHQLVGVQARNQNLVEAGLTLKLHADMLDWSLERRVDSIAALQLPAQSAFERKEQLYLQILEYFNAGQAWELGVELCRELAHHYEHTVFDYTRLSDMLRQQAVLHENIVQKERYFSEYFRVGFYGKSFPPALRGRQYIYRGLEWEKIGAFCERIQNKYPAARLLKSSGPPSDHILSSDCQYVQITSVQPEPDRTRAMFTKGDIVPAAVRAYYEHNDVSTFSFSRPFRRNPSTQTSNEFLDLWTEKTVLVTEHPFPSMLRRAEIVRTVVTELSPIENAIIAMRAKNRELLALEKKYLVCVGSGRVSCNPFTMSLNGAVNAPVNGGVKLYKQAFLQNEQYLRGNPDKARFIHELDDAVLEQAEVISRCLDVHGRIVPTEMIPLHENLLQFFRVNFADEIKRL